MREKRGCKQKNQQQTANKNIFDTYVGKPTTSVCVCAYVCVRFEAKEKERERRKTQTTNSKKCMTRHGKNRAGELKFTS